MCFEKSHVKLLHFLQFISILDVSNAQVIYHQVGGKVICASCCQMLGNFLLCQLNLGGQVFSFNATTSLADCVVPLPGCGQSVTDFSGWDAHAAQLHCLNEVDGDIRV
jgi:hypothetical protein